MAGNMWEWTADFYSADYYSKSPAKNPQGPETGYVFVERGGSWRLAKGQSALPTAITIFRPFWVALLILTTMMDTDAQRLSSY